MSKTVQQKIKKYRKKRILPKILRFFFTAIIIGICCGYAMLGIFVYATELKMKEQLRNIDQYSEIINTYTIGGQDYEGILDIFSRLENGPEAMCITSEDGIIISSYNKNINMTKGVKIDDYLGKPIDMDSNEQAKIFNDKDKDVLDVNPVRIIKDFKGNYRKEVEEYDSFFNSNFKSKVLYSADVWIVKDSINGSDRLFIKTSVLLCVSDLIMPIGIILGIATFLVILLIVQLISGIKEVLVQQSYSKALFMDTITGGNNWLYFSTYAEKELKKYANVYKTYAVVDITLMKYRGYCSLYGVKDGEELLEAVHRYLDSSLKSGEICARYGKASFALLLRVIDTPDKYNILENRINEIIQQAPGRLSQMDVKNTGVVIDAQRCRSLVFHAGVSLIEPIRDENTGKALRRKNVDVLQLYNNAGIARGTIGIDEGSSTVFFDQEMCNSQIWEQKVESSMSEALKNEEFQVYLQPKFNPVTEELEGAEALVRWISPTEGFISPGKFIPIFEKTGFVTRLDDYMISHVAKLQAKWLSEGKKIVPVSVNVSRAHFAKEDLAEHIRDLVDVYGVPHEYIEIELTESAFFDDKAALINTVLKMQEYGFYVSMDDFGSGYSSLNSLKDLPLNVLKLDAEFFKGENAEGERGEIVVARAIALAKQLNMKVVAEGVEKKEQVDFLAKQKCDMIQGFYFAKPMPAEEYQKYFE